MPTNDLASVTIDTSTWTTAATNSTGLAGTYYAPGAQYIPMTTGYIPEIVGGTSGTTTPLVAPLPADWGQWLPMSPSSPTISLAATPLISESITRFANEIRERKLLPVDEDGFLTNLFRIQLEFKGGIQPLPSEMSWHRFKDFCRITEKNTNPHICLPPPDKMQLCLKTGAIMATWKLAHLTKGAHNEKRFIAMKFQSMEETDSSCAVYSSFTDGNLTHQRAIKFDFDCELGMVGKLQDSIKFNRPEDAF